jgi:D-alanine-D-alanine ligase
MSQAPSPGRILILWNQVEDDVYEHLKADGPQALPWRDGGALAETMATANEELDRISGALRGAGHAVEVVNVRDDLRRMLAAIAEHRPDAIMNLVEFFGDDPSHEQHVPAVFELLGVAYTGARPGTLELCQRKHRAKSILRAAGLPTAPYFVVSGLPGEERAPRHHGLHYPMIVKPALEDASGGIDHQSVVHDRAALDAKLAAVLAEHGGPVLVEEYIDGREIHCAILGADPPVALPLYEMEFLGHDDEHGRPLPKIITYRAKWDPLSRDHYSMQGRCPAEGLEPEVIKHVQDVALRAYRALDGRDYARIDMRLDLRTGEPIILEMNPNPDLADVCAFAQCAAASGRSYPQVVNEIVGFALARGRATPAARPEIGDDLLREVMARKLAGTRA